MVEVGEDGEEDVHEEEEEDYNNGRYYSDRRCHRNLLAYQNNECYLDLVQELEETLQNRSRKRFHRTKNVFDCHETSESEEPIKQRICYLNDKTKNYPSCRKPPNEDVLCSASRQSKSPRRRSKSPPCFRRTKNRDSIDRKTGEWFKVEEKPIRKISITSSPPKCFQRYDCTCENQNYR